MYCKSVESSDRAKREHRQKTIRQGRGTKKNVYFVSSFPFVGGTIYTGPGTEYCVQSTVVVGHFDKFC